MAALELPRHRWTRDEYALLEGLQLRCELLDGEVIDVAPMSIRHSVTAETLRDVLSPLVPDGWCMGGQTPVAIGEHSEPEPDGWVATQPRRAFHSRKPDGTDLNLVIEVSETTHWYDAGAKLRVYAEARIPTYWIVDLRRNVIEVYSDPADADYASLVTLTPRDMLPLPWGGEVAVRDVVPDDR